MRKKFVQTLAARQLEYGEHIRVDAEMNFAKQSTTKQQQQSSSDGSGEEIIEILDDDQEVELMMERHRKYHPRKYVNLQHPPSKIYYDKIDKVVSPLGDREDQEDEDERNHLVIEETSPKELNTSAMSTGSHGSAGSGNLDGSVFSVENSIPRNEEEALLLQEFQYRRLYGYSASIPSNATKGGRPSSREQQQPHKQRLKKRVQKSQDLPGPIMGPPASYQYPMHPPQYERSHPYGQRLLAYERNVRAPNTTYYRTKDDRRTPQYVEAPRVPQVPANGTFVVPEARQFPKGEAKRNSAFSPPRVTGRSTPRIMLADASKTNAMPIGASGVTEVGGGIITPRTPRAYYQQQNAYHRSSVGAVQPPREANSYLALEEWYRTGVPPPHMLTSADLQSMYYYHYYLNKMAASSVYHHPYRDHTLAATPSTVPAGVPIIGPIGGISPDAASATAIVPPPVAYPPPQYGFAKGHTTDQRGTLYCTQQPFDYAVYHTLVTTSGYMPTSACQSPQTAETPKVPSASSSATDIIRPSVINRAPMPATVPQTFPRTVPVNLVHPSSPPSSIAHGGGPMPAADLVSLVPAVPRDHDQEPALPKPVATKPLIALESPDNVGIHRSGGDNERLMANVTLVGAVINAQNKPCETVQPMIRSSGMMFPQRDNRPVGSASTNQSPRPTTPFVQTTPQQVQGRPRGRPPGAKNKEHSTMGQQPKTAKASSTSVTASTASALAASARRAKAPVVATMDPTTINTRVEFMKHEVDSFLNRRRTDVITTMRLYSIGRIDFDGMLQEMKRHSIVYRDFHSVAYELIKNAQLPGFVREPPVELDYRWKSPPQEFADYFAQNEQCSTTFVKENFDFLALIVDNLLKQYFEPLEYFLLTYVLGLRVK